MESSSNLRYLERALPDSTIPIVEIAKLVLPDLTPEAYDWENATTLHGIDMWQEAQGAVPDEFICIHLKLKGYPLSDFHVEVVHVVSTGRWKLSAGYNDGRANELTLQQRAIVEQYLSKLPLNVVLESYYSEAV